MTFFNDLWKKFKQPIQEVNEKQSQKSGVSEDSPDMVKKDFDSLFKSSSVLKNAESVLSAFEHLETESTHVYQNLSKIKNVVEEPKILHPLTPTDKQKLELRFSTIKQHLGTPECHETVRQERWQPNIHCPDCNSGNLKRLTQIPPQTPYKHRYRCLECGLVFNDDSGTPLEQNIPPLNIWMQCWYLLGCTESLTYIASRLNLDLTTVEYMAEQLRIIFKAKQPLTRFVDYEEWSKQSQHLRAQLKEDLLKQYERLSADIAGVPKDTAEFRRQQNLRRDLVSSTNAPSTGKKRS